MNNCEQVQSDLVCSEEENKALAKLIMVAKKVTGSESTQKVILYDNDDDVSCWNCAKRTNSKKCLEPITLAKVRQQHREKFKLYSFLISEVSKPKVVPLKQKINEPLTITRIIDEKLAEDARVCNAKESYASNLKIFPLNTDKHVYQNSTKNINDLTSELVIQKQVLNRRETRKRTIEDEKNSHADNDVEKCNKILPNNELSEMVDNNTQESVLYKLEIKTPSKIKCNVNVPKLSISENDETVHKEINYGYVKEIKDNYDKIDSVSSDFGKTVSSFRNVNEEFDSNKTISSSENVQPYSLENASSEPLNVRNFNYCKEYKQSMPVLYASSNEANKTFTKSVNSLCTESSFNKKVKMMRWSSFSLCKKPYDIDGMFLNLFFVQFVVIYSRTHLYMHQSPLLWAKFFDSASGAARITYMTLRTNIVTSING